MAELSTVARPYAKAAFEYARDHQALTTWSEWLAKLGQVVADAEMQKVLSSPKLSADRKVTLLAEIAELIGPDPLALGGPNCPTTRAAVVRRVQRARCEGVAVAGTVMTPGVGVGVPGVAVGDEVEPGAVMNEIAPPPMLLSPPSMTNLGVRHAESTGVDDADVRA